MSAGDDAAWNVARYLATRLQQLGIRYLYGVPGNHLGPFLTEMHARKLAEWVGTPTEMGAGYAADGYARIHGVGAVAVTYGVGAFSLINTVSGAYVEQVPLVAINASPKYEQWLTFRAVGVLTSHMSPRFESNLDAYRQVTVDAQVITNSRLAPAQIDGALTACLTERRPVYLEIMEDVWTSECAPPAGELKALDRPVSDRIVEQAATAAVERIRQLGRPILWGGEEIDRLRLETDFQDLVDATSIPFCTTIGGKSILSEYHPCFHGVYNGKASLPEVIHIFKEVAKCRVGLGAWTTSKNLSGEQALGEDWIMAAHDGVTVGSSYFPNVALGPFLRKLREKLVAEYGERAFAADYYGLQSDIDAGAGTEATGDAPVSREAFLDDLSQTFPSASDLTYDNFFQRIGEFLEAADEGSWPQVTNPYVVVTDAAFALLGAQNLPMAERRSFIAQNAWLAIGYSVGAVTGVGGHASHQDLAAGPGGGPPGIVTKTSAKPPVLLGVLGKTAEVGLRPARPVVTPSPARCRRDSDRPRPDGWAGKRPALPAGRAAPPRPP